jgi:predicted enzyme related to lactoylglutathione lyase
MPPTLGNGKICYLEIPATDITASSSFYAAIFGWSLRIHGDGSVAFDDGVHEVSGTWVLDRPPSTDPGVIIYIMVNNAERAVRLIAAGGGQIVKPLDPAAREITAHFRDPAGNLFGIYQERH